MATTEEQTDQAEALARRAARVIPGGVNSGQRRVPGLEGLVVTGTSGARFSDAEGRTFTDYHAAFGPPLLGHNDPDVDGAVANLAQAAEDPVFQYLQQLGLHLQVNVADFVKKNRSMIGDFQQALFGADCAGESTLFMAK